MKKREMQDEGFFNFSHWVLVLDRTCKQTDANVLWYVILKPQ